MSVFAKLAAPAPIAEVFVAPATLDRIRGREAVEATIKQGFLRPFDIGDAEIDEPALLYVPFWRIDASVDGWHVGISRMSVGRADSQTSFPIPTGGARSKDGVILICARTLMPFVPKLPAFYQKWVGTPPLTIDLNELVQQAEARAALARGEIVDADVGKEHAEKMATGMLLRAVNPSNAIYAKYEPQVRASTFCLYPLYYARYRYRGEATPQACEELFVAVSGRTGEVVSSKHPSEMRAVAAKVRRLLSFDLRRR